jgi:hypothetical protein
MKALLTKIILQVFKVVFGQVDSFNNMNEKGKNYKPSWKKQLMVATIVRSGYRKRVRVRVSARAIANTLISFSSKLTLTLTLLILSYFPDSS